MKLGIRAWILIFVLLLAFLSIAPWKSFSKGVVIESVDSNSTYFEQGLRAGQIISYIDGEKVNNLEDFSRIINSKNYSGEKIKTSITTNQGAFLFFSEEQIKITVNNLPKSNLKTGLDFSGGSRALVKAQDKKLSSSELND